MKNLCILFIALSTIFLTSCEGPQGAPGTDGGLIVAPAFEIEVDFNATNNYEYFESYGFYIYPSDVVLVYILWEVDNGQEVWRLMPQTVDFINTSLTYNFDFTLTDVRFFLDGTVNLNTLDPSWTQNQVFRVVVIPADNVGKHSYENLDTVMEAYNIESFEKR